MADAKISALTALTGANTASTDLFPLVDVSDTTMAASGTTKKTTRADLQVYVGGTVTTSTPTLDLSQTWNSGAVTFTGIKQNITNTASAAASLLMDLQVGGSSLATVTRGGSFGATNVQHAFSNIGSGYTTSYGFDGAGNLLSTIAGTKAARLSGTNQHWSTSLVVGWTSGSVDGTALDTAFSRVSAGVVAVGNGTAADVSGTLQAKVLNGIGGTVTSSTPVLDITQIWNAGAVSFTAIKANITNTASAAASKLMDLQVGGTSMASISRIGLLSLGDASVNAGVVVGGQNALYWSGAQLTYQQHLIFPSAGNYDVGQSGGECRTVFSQKYTATTGTITADTPMFNGTQTWNNGAVTFTGIKANITNTASAAASMLMDLQVGGTSLFSVAPTGGVGGVGPMVKIGTGSTTNVGFQIGYSQSGYGGIWASGVTPSTSNFALQSNGSSTYLCGTGGVFLGANGAGHVEVISTAIRSAYNVTLGATGGYEFGGLFLTKTVTTGGTTGAQTINKPTGSVNFAAAATSLVVTNSLVTTSSIIMATVATNDSTMKSVQAVAGTGSFTLYANAAATAETRVNFLITN